MDPAKRKILYVYDQVGPMKEPSAWHDHFASQGLGNDGNVANI